MNLPKFLLADNSQIPEDIFIVHTEFPRFIINLKDDEIEWLEHFSEIDEEELEEETVRMIELASVFYDNEMKEYE